MINNNIIHNIGFAIMAHDSTNHKYDDKPYSIHLQMVCDYYNKYSYLLPDDKKEIVESACWLHDSIEDCRLTYNDIVKEAGIEVAEIVYACTNEKGKTRLDRANEKYYNGIRNTQYATFVKLCDRLANVTYSKNNNSKMFEVYKKELNHFLHSLFPNDFLGLFFSYEENVEHVDMINELYQLCND
jgi:(p)ppGpp synthase/HD superfamily hydrolase